MGIFNAAKTSREELLRNYFVVLFKTGLSLDWHEACNFIKKETLAQVFSCEFSEISKNTFSTEHLWTTACESFQPCMVNSVS